MVSLFLRHMRRSDAPFKPFDHLLDQAIKLGIVDRSGFWRLGQLAHACIRQSRTALQSQDLLDLLLGDLNQRFADLLCDHTYLAIVLKHLYEPFGMAYGV